MEASTTVVLKAADGAAQVGSGFMPVAVHADIGSISGEMMRMPGTADASVVARAAAG